jgi:hypothetical protein
MILASSDLDRTETCWLTKKAALSKTNRTPLMDWKNVSASASDTRAFNIESEKTIQIMDRIKYARGDRKARRYFKGFIQPST